TDKGWLWTGRDRVRRMVLGDGSVSSPVGDRHLERRDRTRTRGAQDNPDSFWFVSCARRATRDIVCFAALRPRQRGVARYWALHDRPAVRQQLPLLLQLAG